jgi:hypothetical protein
MQSADEAPAYLQRTEPAPAARGWAEGFILFASIMMIIVGLFHAFFGLAYLFSGEFLVVEDGYTYAVDTTVWGIVHFILGSLVLAAGCLLFSGKRWAMIVGIVFAAVSVLTSFLSIPYHPAWSLVIIALSIGTIWALATHGADKTATT